MQCFDYFMGLPMCQLNGEGSDGFGDLWFPFIGV